MKDNNDVYELDNLVDNILFNYDGYDEIEDTLIEVSEFKYQLVDKLQNYINCYFERKKYTKEDIDKIHEYSAKFCKLLDIKE